MQITDASGYAGQADQVFTPRSEEEVAEILARASSQGVPVTVMGALTARSAGAGVLLAEVVEAAGRGAARAAARPAVALLVLGARAGAGAAARAALRALRGGADLFNRQRRQPIRRSSSVT